MYKIVKRLYSFWVFLIYAIMNCMGKERTPPDLNEKREPIKKCDIDIRASIGAIIIALAVIVAVVISAITSGNGTAIIAALVVMVAVIIGGIIANSQESD